MKSGKIFLFNITILFLMIFMGMASGLLAEESEINSPQNTLVFNKSFATLLPLTGSYSVLGERASRGVATAIQLTEKGPLYQMYVRDVSEFEPDILKIYTELVTRNNLSFVLGPLTSQSTNEVSKVVDKYNVPTITFPVFEDTTEDNSTLIKFQYPIEDQIETLVDFTVDNLKITKFAVLYPKTKFGMRFKERFIEYAKLKGGKFLHVSSYSQDLSGIDVELKWIKPFDPEAIVIADNPSRAAGIITKLAEDQTYQNVLFIGPNTWNTSYFSDLLDKEVDGLIHKAVFTDYLNTESREWKEFESVYKSVFEDSPGLFEYQVYKVTRLLFNLDNNGDNSKSLFEKIKDLEASGGYRVKKTKTGLVFYPKPYILSLEGDDFKVVD